MVQIDPMALPNEELPTALERLVSRRYAIDFERESIVKQIAALESEILDRMDKRRGPRTKTTEGTEA